MTRRYLVVYEWAGKNFSGYSPDVPGCVSSGRTLLAMRRNMREALESHLQWMFDDGDPLPEATARTVSFEDEDKEFPNPPGYYFVVEKLEVKLPSRKKISPAKRARSRKAA
jgi:predicted RNase H-like HicB family nuclease